VNADAIEELGARHDMYVAVSRLENHDQRKYDYRPRSATERAEKVIKDPRLVAMREKLQTDEGRRKYAKRKRTVEPAFGVIKSVMGFRQLLLRGHAKVSGEWSLLSLAYNFKRIWRLQALA
jgi:hypothetical protein